MPQRGGNTGEEKLDRQLAVLAARRFYLEDRSKIEIGDELGISRFKVARLLEQARSAGLVRIEIDDSGFIDHERATAMCDALGLDRAVVVAAHGGDDEVRHVVGRAAADLLGSSLRDGEVLGLGWGRTLSATAQELGRLPKVSVVQLTGATEMTRHLSPVEVVRAIGLRSGGEVRPIFAPLLADDADTAAAFRRQPAIARAVVMFDHVTTAVMSVGSWSPAVSQLHDAVEPETRARLLANGVVAEIGVTLVDALGSEVAPEFTDRCVAVSAAQLRRIPRVIGVASGSEKAHAAVALARGGWVSELVVDETLADAAIALAEHG